MFLTLLLPTLLLIVACGGGVTPPAQSPPDPPTSRPTATASPTPTVPVASQAQPQELMPTRNHLPMGDSISYSTAPPTSGDHWDRWADCGIYLEGVPDELIVHNLEHSNIVVSYNLATEEEIARLLSAVNGVASGRNWGVVRRYDQLEPGTVALTTWGLLEVLEGTDGADRGRIAAFFDEFSGELGPEKIPC